MKSQNEIYVSVKESGQRVDVEFQDGIGPSIAKFRRSLRLATRDAAKEIGFQDTVVINWHLLDLMSAETSDEGLGEEDMGQFGMSAEISLDREVSKDEFSRFVAGIKASLMCSDCYLVEDVADAQFEDQDVE